MFLSLTPPLLCLILMFTTEKLHMSTATLSDFYLHNDHRTVLYDARRAARTFFNLPFAPTLDIDLTRTRLNTDMSLVLLFRARPPHRNLLTPNGLAAIKRAEDAILHHRDYPRFCFRNPHARSCTSASTPPECMLPDSLLLSPHLYGVRAASGYVCGRRNDSSAPSTAMVAAFVAEVVTNRSYEHLLGRFAPRSAATWIASTRIPIGTPFTGFISDADRWSHQSELYASWVRSVVQDALRAAQPNLDAFVLGIYLGRMRFSEAVYNDLVYGAAALAVVTVLLIVHTQSLFLAVVAIVQVMLAFPLALVIYKHVFRLPYFSALHVFAVYLLLGIAADDVFVFTDAWKQASVFLGECDLFDRMAWTYRRAVKAMSVTSITTAVSFFIMAASSIMPISTFGFWAAILILTQFALVITVYPCALVIWQRHLRNAPWFPPCFRRTATPLMIENGPSKSDTDFTDPGKKSKSSAEVDIENPQSVGFIKRNVNRLKNAWRNEDSTEYRFLERLFNGPWTNGLNRIRYALVVIAVVLMGITIGLVTQLKSMEEQQTLISQDLAGQIAEKQLRTEFPMGDVNERITVRMLWGVEGVNRTGTSYYLREKVGSPILDDTFDLKSKDAQYLMLNVCRSLMNNSKLVDVAKPPEKRVRCWIEDFLAWRNERWKKDVGFEDYPNDKSLLFDVLSFGTYVDMMKKRPYLKYLTGKDVMVSNDFRRIVTSEIRFTTRLMWRSSPSELQTLYEEWSRANQDVTETAPVVANKPFVTAGHALLFQVAQRRLMQSMVIGEALLLAVTAVILTVMTQSVVTSLLATTALAGIVCSMLAVVYGMGWRLGISEILTVVMSVGYSFDGVAHIATAYSESGADSALERTRDALTTLGTSIVFGTLSTALSSSMLLLANVLILRKLGILIVVTMVMTVLWSLILLPASLMVVQPRGKTVWLQNAMTWVWSNTIKRCLRVETEDTPSHDKSSAQDDDATGSTYNTNKFIANDKSNEEHGHEAAS